MLIYFNNKSIRFKLLFYFIIIIILCVSTLSFFGGNIYKDSLEEEANMHTDQMINQVWSNIKTLIEENENIIYYLSQEELVKEFMIEQDSNSSTEQLIKDKMEIYKNRHPEIAGMLILNKKDRFISNEISRISRDPLTKEPWYLETIESPEKTHLISNPIGRNIKNNSSYQVNNVLTIVKAYRDSATNEVTGVILIDLKLDFIKNIIESIKLGKSGFVFITDENGKVVYAPVNDIVYRIHPSWLQNENSSPVEQTIKGNNYQIIYNTISDIGWKVAGVFSLDETTEVVSEVQKLTFVIALITLLVGSIFSLFFASMITKPVNKLKTLMGNVEEGRFDLRFHSKYTDEIGQLGKSYNKMIDEIERLIELVYKEQKSKREAELEILQAQIKPHFLYNTLDTIQWMADEYHATKITELVSALTTLFRIGLNKGKEFITVEEEVEHVKSYLIIQMTRYESKLEYEISMNESLKDYQVLKLILQPLVENAIYHGIRNKRGKGKILINIDTQDGKLLFAVHDTGIGMKSDTLREINNYLKENDSNESKGYGLFNVNERIKLSYGTDYGLEVYSEFKKGTTIYAILPLKPF
ncbi:HAMP domain-containing protein [Gracilibacillus salitolerans]|uniref:histidine kinase n=1 Tax=Gracilibacillus salitolerans TaxID=2663022 RepID=A0A5Q2TPD7_9BACI|nr:sensor histidine kinase [Gracilibacillus salitolerans]QGH36011.1 HAMP domain-containing protein [Gracilibacillus salitolerans]